MNKIDRYVICIYTYDIYIYIHIWYTYIYILYIYRCVCVCIICMCTIFNRKSISSQVSGCRRHVEQAKEVAKKYSTDPKAPMKLSGSWWNQKDCIHQRLLRILHGIHDDHVDMFISEIFPWLEIFSGLLDPLVEKHLLVCEVLQLLYGNGGSRMEQC